MSIKRFESRSLRLQHTYRVSLWLSGLLFTLIFISCVDGAAQSDQVVARGQKAFFEAWLGRELRSDELRKVTDEFIAYYTKQGKDRAGVHEATKLFLEYAKILREQDGTPRAHTLRHRLLEANYFSTEMQNTTELRLLLEPDPVRVVDPGGKFLMTERDVVALANLNSFSNSGGEPHHMELSRREIDRLVVVLDRHFRSSESKAFGMQRFFREAAALWAGIQREWPGLSAEQKRQARAYARKGAMARMESKMYAKLLDLDTNAAFSHWADDSMSIQMKIAAMEDYLRQIEAELNN